MTEQSIIELSSYNSVSKNSSSEFVCKLSKPITLYENDVIQVRNCFLDTRLISNQNINFDTDQNVSITFYYYLIFTGYKQVKLSTDFGAKLTATTPDYGDGLPYVVVDARSNQPITGNISFTIPAGTYSCDGLATLMSRYMQKPNEIPNIDIEEASYGDYSIGATKSLESSLITTILNYMGDDEYNLRLDNIGGFYGSNIKIIPLISASSLTAENSLGYASDYISGYYTGSGFNDIDAGLVGAKEFSIQFNNENSGKFEFTYMHTPLVDSSNSNEVICCRQQAPAEGYPHVRYVWYNRLSGVFFQNLQPQSFWQQLGFNVNDICFTSQQVMNRLNYQSFQNATTRNYIATQNIFSSVSIDVNDDDDNKEASLILLQEQKFNKPYNTYYDSDKTWPVLAPNNPISSNTNAGHYLLEIKEYESQYINDDKTYRIKGVIPTYYLSQDSFATSYEDTLTYIHKGQPLQLSSLSVRLLNPITKEPAELGDNNTIYLQITNNNIMTNA